MGGVFPNWLVLDYGADAQTVGWLSLIFGCGEMVGIFCVTNFSDRMGLRRSVFVGGILIAAVQLLLCFLQSFGKWPSMVCFGLTAAASEFTFVAGMSWVSSGDIVPDSIGTCVGLYFCFGNIGGLLATFVIVPVFTAYGLAGISMLGATVASVSVAVLWFAIKPTDVNVVAQ
jgi:predicted MFS family arabinose efflux permease